jgi:ABC-2 type transport system ATP-binding protein
MRKRPGDNTKAPSSPQPGGAAAPSSAPAPAAVEFIGVGKTYRGGLWSGPVQAVDKVNLRIDAGQVFGLLGPNRAGKTTLVKLLLSLARPSAGEVIRLGRPVADRSTLARIGYMHENHAFPRHLTARELLHYYGALSLVSGELLGPRATQLLERVGLADRAAEPISRFSKGMVQRLGLAQALINEPDLLVLDEPTEGLDLGGRKLLREVVNQTRAAGRTVLLVSHVLTEAEQLCDRIAVLVNGKLVHTGPTAELRRDPASGANRPLEQALQPLYEKAVS